ncbi:MAG: DUF4363 family protein [Ruminococcaceae bacterium]|nr:DUF4363 family protein [Oscillospiraceae bacterium]
MNRLWIGIVILFLLLGLGVGLMWGSVAFFGSLSQKVEACGEAALRGNWAFVARETAECEEKWEKYAHFWASFTDHAPVEQVETLFAQLELYKKQRLSVEFAACCRSLAKEADAIGESHGIAWWSIL